MILIAVPPSAALQPSRRHEGVPSLCARCVSPELGSSSASDRSCSILLLLLKMMALRCIGSCLPLFVMAIVFDILGVVLLFVGIFGNVRMRGVFYGDFLIHTGALVLFASLALWLMWYVGTSGWRMKVWRADQAPRSASKSSRGSWRRDCPKHTWRTTLVRSVLLFNRCWRELRS